MIELPLVLIAGLLGSSHCIGMCGPFALVIGQASPSLRSNALRQCLYSAGRVFTYAVLGAFVGFFGWRITRAAPALANLPAVLAIVAGLLLIWQGLISAGVIRLGNWKIAKTPCLAGTFFAGLLTGNRWLDVFLAGMFTGLLPCGLLYAMLALAASSANIPLAMATMIAFGLGTMPIMFATGLLGTVVSSAARRKLYVVAAWCVVLTGTISVARGASFVRLPGYDGGGHCPMCNH
jgi:sulfite exporter TauE/SafE